jgi:hypothetical protein
MFDQIFERSDASQPVVTELRSFSGIKCSL